MPGRGHLPSLLERILRTLRANTNRTVSGLGSNASPGMQRDRVAASVRGGATGLPPTARSSKIDQFTITGTGTSTFTLTYTPIVHSWNVTCSWDLDDSVDYGIVGKTLTIVSPTTVFIGASATYPKTLQVQYDYLTSVPTAPTDEVPTDRLIWLYPGDWSTGATTGHIGTWNDSSGNNNDGTTSGSSVDEPLITTGATPGGTSAATFDGSRVLYLPAALMTGVTAAEVFWVLRATASGDDPGLHMWGARSAYTRYGGAPSGGQDQIVDTFGTSAARTFNAGPTGTLQSWHVYSVRAAAGDWAAYLDNASLASYASNTVGWSDVQPRIGVSGIPFFSALFWSGQLAELVAYARVLTTTERTAVYNDLVSRHGL